jgi:OmpA-OmpF porin, OOP family
MLVCAVSTAQINIGDKLEQKARERLERRVDRTIDQGFDKTEEGVDQGARSATKRKDKDGTDGTEEIEHSPSHTGAEGGSSNAGTAATSARMTAYGKFDFVPGDKVIAMEDYMQDAIGDFPGRWNTNTSGEVVTISGHEGRWLKLSGEGFYYPEFLGTIPENATVEFGAAVLEEYGLTCRGITVHFMQDGNLLKEDRTARVSVGIHPDQRGHTDIVVYDVNKELVMTNRRNQDHFVEGGVAPVAQVSLWRQKNRLRVYLNEEKVWDIPRAFQNDVDYRMTFESGTCKVSPYLGNLRVAAGAPDTRNKLITEGRFVTSGILFDSGSDRIRPESHGTIKEIATVLQENGDVRVRIIGHTDSDGDDARNLELSKRRAAAVKEILASEFKLDGARMETDGKGESQPAGPNDTPQGKANNRRVEFVKL